MKMKMIISVVLLCNILFSMNSRRIKDSLLPANCNMSKQMVTNEDKKLIVNMHNDLRNKVATQQTILGKSLPGAGNMIQMYWSETLAQKAQDWANQCNNSHASAEFRKMPQFQAGDNISIQHWQNGTPKMDWKVAINKWSSQINQFNGKNAYKYKPAGPESGDFTQMIWADTFLMGCGYAVFKAKFPQALSNIYVCFYGPAGDRPNMPMYRPPVNNACNCYKGLGCNNQIYKQLCCVSGKCDNDDVVYTGNIIPETLPK